MRKGPSTTQYIGGIVADQLSKMAATIIGSIFESAHEIMLYLSCQDIHVHMQLRAYQTRIL